MTYFNSACNGSTKARASLQALCRAYRNGEPLEAHVERAEALLAAV